MTQFTPMVCLAKSYKHGGACVAGKRWDGDHTGPWIRPVADADGGAIRPPARLRVLDLVEVPLAGPVPQDHQVENHRLALGHPWRFRGRLGWNDLDALLDRPAPLWENGHHSTCGRNDRVPPGAADDSLRLIRVPRFDLVITDDGKLRGRFRYLDTDYDLVVTDLWLSPLRYRPPAIHRLTDVVLCVSLGEIFQGYCYKLVAALLYPKRFA